MKMTRALAKRIREACVKRIGCTSVEIGFFGMDGLADDDDGCNRLTWPAEADWDLDDMEQPHKMIGRNLTDYHGWLLIDCYCRHPSWGLDNIDVLIDPIGQIVKCDLRGNIEISEAVALVSTWRNDLASTGEIDRRWKTGTVRSLANRMLKDCNFDAMPILADALMDAGCDNDGLISLCRRKCPAVLQSIV